MLLPYDPSELHCKWHTIWRNRLATAKQTQNDTYSRIAAIAHGEYEMYLAQYICKLRKEGLLKDD